MPPGTHRIELAAQVLGTPAITAATLEVDVCARIMEPPDGGADAPYTGPTTDAAWRPSTPASGGGCSLAPANSAAPGAPPGWMALLLLALGWRAARARAFSDKDQL